MNHDRLSPSETAAQAIFHAAVEAVDSARLVRQALRIEAGEIRLGGRGLKLRDVHRILVVGFGKAGAGMARGVESVLGETLLAEKSVMGWVNVPEDCVASLNSIHLHPARPAGRNEPTAAGMQGAREILQLVEETGPHDLCLCLISGGGSALAPAPAAGVSLDDKLEATRFLSAAGADIRQLNTVRKAISEIKGGALLRAASCPVWSLIISDVIGDPLDIIASGPTVDEVPNPLAAIEVLRQFEAERWPFGPRLVEFLETAAESQASLPRFDPWNIVIGNNQTAIDAALVEARRLGFAAQCLPPNVSEGSADGVGQTLARHGLELAQQPEKQCLLWGGEPTVTLAAAATRGVGGRNQQAALAALAALPRGVACDWTILSAGTDGEDGPTDAAGAWASESVRRRARERNLDAEDYLRRNDAYHFFQQAGGLLITGPTHTNVCDVRVVVTMEQSSATQ